MQQNFAILLPLATLVIWSTFMLIWGIGLRTGAMVKLKIHPQKHQRSHDLGAALPANVQWKADNYNHLMEQPTLFYTVVLALAVMGEGVGLNMALAWAYVGSRIVHSLVQVTTNAVMVRFSVFCFSTLILLALGLNLLLRVLTS